MSVININFPCINTFPHPRKFLDQSLISIYYISIIRVNINELYFNLGISRRGRRRKSMKISGYLKQGKHLRIPKIERKRKEHATHQCLGGALVLQARNIQLQSQ